MALYTPGGTAERSAGNVAAAAARLGLAVDSAKLRVQLHGAAGRHAERCRPQLCTAWLGAHQVSWQEALSLHPLHCAQWRHQRVARCARMSVDVKGVSYIGFICITGGKEGCGGTLTSLPCSM